MRKRFLSLALALALCLSLAVPAMAAEKTVEETIPCQFDNAGWFHEGLAWVEVDGKYGYMNKDGEIVIPAVYDEAVDFSEGLAPVKQNGKWGFINPDGETVVDFVYNYDKIYPFFEGLAVIVRNNKYGYIDQTGKVRYLCILEEARSFSDGFAAYQQDNGYWSFFNTNLLSAHIGGYEKVSDFSEGFAAVYVKGRWAFVSPSDTSSVTFPMTYDGVDILSGGLAAVWTDGKIGFVNKDCEEVIPLQYENAARFSDGFTLVQQGGKWGVIDKTGKEIVPFQYDDAGSFVDGFAPVMLNGKGGYINTTGKVVVSFQYDRMADFSDGMARVGVKQADGSYRYGFLAIVDGKTEITAAVSDWAKESVDVAAAAGLIADGLGEDYTKNITRAQFAAVSVKLYEAMSGETAPADSDKTFTDTSDPAVLQAAALGIVGGYDDGSFGPDDLVTREQAATMLSCVHTKLGGEIPTVDATTFADDGEVSGYAKASVAFMADKGIVGGVGDNKFAPQGNATIEQALIIALRMFEKLK